MKQYTENANSTTNVVPEQSYHVRQNIAKLDASVLVHTLVHLGAGQCGELDGYLALQAHHILLVEADPIIAEALEKDTHQFPHVQVKCAAVAGHAGPATFHRYNLRSAGSLHAPDGLLRLFPGLRMTERVEVHAVTPKMALESLELQIHNNNWLIIDLPGEELPVLKALMKDNMLDLFCKVQIHCGQQALYAGGESAEKILEWLNEAGFILVREEATEDPDRPCWTTLRNRLHVENRDLRNKNISLQSQIDELKVEAEALAKCADSLRQKVDVLKHERDEQTRLAEELQSFSNNLKRGLEERTKCEAEYALKEETLQKKLEQTEQECNKQAMIAVEYQNRIQELESMLTDSESKRIALTDEITRAEGQITLLKDIFFRELGK